MYAAAVLIAASIFAAKPAFCAEATWSFSDSQNYVYDDTSIEVAGDEARLIRQDEQHVDDDEADFDAGTYTDADWIAGYLQLIPDGGPYPASGIYESRVIDSNSIKAEWTTLNWQGEEVNYGAELPNDEGSDNGADMSDNALLLHLDELSGDAIDSSGNGNDCTNNGAAYGAPGQFETAFSFVVGDQDYLNCGAGASLDIGDEVTTEAWVKPTAATYGYLLTKNHYTRYAVFVDGDSQFRTYMGGSSYATNYVFPIDRYTHVASVYDRVAGELKHFIDGELKNTFSVSTVIDDDGLELNVGRRCNAVGDCVTGQYYFNGDVDELAFYTRALGDDEVGDHYKRGVLKVRVQACSNGDGAACADFVGPDGTNATYFTDPSSSVLSVADDRYFQYRVELLSDDVDLTPMLDGVAVDFGYYSDDLPDIQPIAENVLPFGRLLTFQESAMKGGGEIYYQVSNDAGSSWLFWDGASWSAAGPGDYNVAAEVNTNIQDVPPGDFLFRAALESDGSQLVSLSEVTASSSPKPTGTFNEAHQESDDDILSFSDYSDLIPNTGDVYVSVDVFDAEGNLCLAGIEYTTDGVTYQQATLGDTTTCDYTDLLGCPGVDNAAAYQLGSVSERGIATAAGSNSVGFIWKSREDAPGFSGAATLRLIVYNPVSLESVPTYRDVTVDNMPPQGLGNIQPVRSYADALQWGWDPVTDESNFARYEIWYGKSSSDVASQSGDAMRWSTAEDASLSDVNESSTTITGLDSGTLYFAKVVAVDHYANSSSSEWSGEVTEAASGGCSATIVPNSNHSNTTLPIVMLLFFIGMLAGLRRATSRRGSMLMITLLSVVVLLSALVARPLFAEEMNYPFSDPTDYAYDGSEIEVAGGAAGLVMMDETTVDDSGAAFDAGTHADTGWVTDRLQIVPDGGPYPTSGEYESEIIDAGGTSSWNTIAWGGEEVNYGDPLPNDQGSDASADMSNDALLYHFEELGGDVADSSGNGNTGTVTNATYGADGRFGKALSFDGSGDYVNAPDSASLSITGTALSLEVWAYPEGSSNAALIHKDHHYTLYRRSDGTITYADSITWSYATIGSYGNAPADQWNHIVVTFDGADIRFYINGALVHTRPRAGSLADNAQPLCIGSYSCSGGYFRGRLDEVAVYDRVLSGPEIEAHYKRGVLRLRAQVRSDDDDAAWGDFVGPDGTIATFFTDPAATALSVADNRYFQYKLFLDTEDDTMTPILDSVSVDRSGYSADRPAIMPAESFQFGRLTTFVETATKDGGQIRYQLSNDGGNAWLYWDGADWSPAGVDDFNTAEVVNTNVQHLPAGDFMFRALLESDGSQHVVLDDISVNSLPLPTGTINDAAQLTLEEEYADADPLPSEALQGLASGDVSVSIDVFDPNGIPCRAKVEWSTDGIAYYPATISGPVSCDYFDLEMCPGVDNDLEYQLGIDPTKRIATAGGSNTVDFLWESRGDIPDVEGVVFFKLTANNWIEDQTTPAVLDVSIDNLAPQGLSDFMIASTADDSMNVSWTPPSSEGNFDHYEVWYGTDLEAVRARSLDAQMIDNELDPALASMSTSGVAVGALESDTLYFAKVFAFDKYGNVATTDADGGVTVSPQSGESGGCSLSADANTSAVPAVVFALGAMALLIGHGVLRRRCGD